MIHTRWWKPTVGTVWLGIYKLWWVVTYTQSTRKITIIIQTFSFDWRFLGWWLIVSPFIHSTTMLAILWSSYELKSFIGKLYKCVGSLNFWQCVKTLEKYSEYLWFTFTATRTSDYKAASKTYDCVKLGLDAKILTWFKHSSTWPYASLWKIDLTCSSICFRLFFKDIGQPRITEK